jgi:hypothetical protein
MKNCLIYGFAMALAAFLLRLVLFIAGLESDPAHGSAARWIGGLGGLAVAVVVLVLGIRARRSSVAPEAEFTYGQAFKTGMGIQLFCAILSPFTTYFYLAVINPHFIDVLLQANREKLEARGMASDQIDRAEHIMRMFTSPGAQAVEAFFGTLIFGAIVTLIVAAFLRRNGTHDPLPA